MSMSHQHTDNTSVEDELIQNWLCGISCVNLHVRLYS